MSAEMGKTAVGYAPVETAGKMVIGAGSEAGLSKPKSQTG